MKIGILTFHRALNYGAVLQCYALYTYLSELGHSVEVIDYRPNAIEKYRMFFRLSDFLRSKGIVGKCRYIVSSMSLVWSKKTTSKKFDVFLSSKLKFSSLVSKPEDVPSYYDLIFFGSDQIWNPEICEGLDTIYLGQFEKGKTKFVGYAASVGILDLIQGDNAELFNRYLTVYDSIGVRELSLKIFLKNTFNIESTMVNDPSLFLTKEQCEKIAKKPKDENYVVVFNLDGNQLAIPFAQRIAEQIDAIVLEIKAETNHLRRYSSKLRSELSPEEFLGYILYSQCVISNSFHATCFSMIMQKDFYTLKRITNNDRVNTILNIAGLEDRFVDAGANVTFSKITNYCEVERKLTDYRKISQTYIMDNL